MVAGSSVAAPTMAAARAWKSKSIGCAAVIALDVPAAPVGGRGGGRLDFAQAGGTEPEKLDAALGRVCEVVAAILDQTP